LVAAIALTGLAAASAALANTTRSTNWAGYAVHRAGVSFSHVSGTWIQPNAVCTPGRSSYSAVWLGLGGYNPMSGALEQIGTEIDCTRTGRVRSSAWYELVPSPSRTLTFAVAPGDVMRANVSVSGHRVTVELDNLTQHRHFRRTLTARMLDLSSAEWIVEAPSECFNQFDCQALPLANFGAVTFENATVTTARGVSGSIANRHWGRTKIKLAPSAQRFIVARNTSDTTGSASPSRLRHRGSSFDVTYASTSGQAGPTLAGRQARLRESYVVH
jgi:hypothetical protein